MKEKDEFEVYGFCPYCGKRSGVVFSFEAWAWCDKHRVKWLIGKLANPLADMRNVEIQSIAARLVDAPDLSTYTKVQPMAWGGSVIQ